MEKKKRKNSAFDNFFLHYHEKVQPLIENKRKFYDSHLRILLAFQT